MSQAGFQFIYHFLRNNQYDPDFYLKKETWTFSEAISFFAMRKTIGPDYKVFKGPIILTNYFNEYYVLIRDAIANGTLKCAEGVKSPFMGKLISFIAADYDKLCRALARKFGNEYPLIDHYDLDKNLYVRDVLEFAVNQDIYVPQCLLDALGIGTSAQTIETREAAAKNFKEYLREERSNAGKQKYQAIRDFCDKTIKRIGMRELEAGCRCLHGDVAKRIKGEVMLEADKILTGNNHINFMCRIDEHIKEAIIALFYSQEDKFDNVRSRVFKGNYYNEYCKRQPPPEPCKIHKND